MDRADQPHREIEMLRERLSRLSRASRRINESLDFETVLQGVLDSARSLTTARYGVMTLLDGGGGVEHHLTSGFTAGEAEQLWLTPEGLRLLEALTAVPRTPAPARPDGARPRPGLRGLQNPPAGGGVRFMAAPMFHREVRVGHVFVGDREDGEEFSQGDEETLAMFAAQAALGHRQRPHPPGGAAGQGRPGDPGQHLAGGSGGIRRPHRRRWPRSTGRPCASWTACGRKGRPPEDLLGRGDLRALRREGVLPAGLHHGGAAQRRGDGAGRGGCAAGARRAQRRRAAQRHAHSAPRTA